MVKPSPSNAEDAGLISGHGTKTPQASGPVKQNIKNRANIVTNSVKTLKKKWSTTTKSLKKEKASLRLIKSKTERNHLPVSYNSLGMCLSSWVRNHSSFLTADYVFTAEVGGGRDGFFCCH